jgi:single-stranded DNA-specific DHH superfamily exonuclease
MVNLVVYHGPCPDGLYGALAADLLLRRAQTRPVYVMYNHFAKEASEAKIREVVKNGVTQLFLVDVVPSEELLRELAITVNFQIIVLDHHATGIATVERVMQDPGCAMMIRSHCNSSMGGCLLAWKHVTGVAEELKDELGPDRVADLEHKFALISANDLGDFDNRDAKHYAMAFRSLNLEMDCNLNPDIFGLLLALNVDGMISIGADLERVKDDTIREEVKKARLVMIQNHPVWLLETSHPKFVHEYKSDAGRELALQAQVRNIQNPVGAVAHRLKDGRWTVSLRSLGFDTANNIAKLYPGGGGQPQASSFSVSDEEFQKILGSCECSSTPR